MNETPSGSSPRTLRRRLAIVNQRGLHARAAARFVKLADRFDADIRVVAGPLEAEGCSIMDLMALGAGVGSEIEVSATGTEADAALAALAALVSAGFDED